MKPTWTSDLTARFDNGTAWPLPEREDEDRETCAHELRYAGSFGDNKAPVSSRARLHGAEVLGVYAQLIDMPLSRSREVLRALKAALAKRDGEAEAAE